MTTAVSVSGGKAAIINQKRTSSRYGAKPAGYGELAYGFLICREEHIISSEIVIVRQKEVVVASR